MLDNYAVIRQDAGGDCKTEKTSSEVLGLYAPLAKALLLCTPPIDTDGLQPGELPYTVLRHEYFHALQHGSGPTLQDVGNGKHREWIREGLAAAAEESDTNLMVRSELFPVLHQVDVPLESQIHPDLYAAQDFWVYYGRRIGGGGLGLFASLFEVGVETQDVASWLGQEQFKSAYWQWAKNQAMAEEELFDGVLGPECAFQPDTVKDTSKSFEPVMPWDLYANALAVLTTHVIRIALTFFLDVNPGDPVTYYVDNPNLNDPDPDLRFKVYVNGEAGCLAVPDGERAVPYDPNRVIYMVVSNVTTNDVKPYLVGFSVGP